MNEHLPFERAIERAVSAEKDAQFAKEGVARINGQMAKLAERVGSLEGAMNAGFASLRQDIANQRVQEASTSSLLALSLKLAGFTAGLVGAGLIGHFFGG